MTTTSVSADQEIRDVVATWARASETGDIEAIKSLMDEDILFLTSGNDPFGRDTFIQHFNNNVKQMNLNVLADVREVEVRDDLAFARTWVWRRTGASGKTRLGRWRRSARPCLARPMWRGEIGRAHV